MTLTNRDAGIIRGMVARGDKRHDIAAWFGENQARIKEAEDGAYGEVAAAPSSELPPKGAPGIKGRRLKAKVDQALEKLNAGKTSEAIALLEEGVARFNMNET